MLLRTIRLLTLLLNQKTGADHYLRTPSDPEFKKAEAIRSIKFEITDDSKDINIQKGDITKHPEVLEFLQKLGISIEEYRAHIGARLRFETVNEIFMRLQDQYSPLTVVICPRFMVQEQC